MERRIYGHRGAPADFPENTLAGFKRAVELGVHGIELDVHLSKDGVAVVCHGGVISSVLSHLEDGPRNDFERYRIANCSITHMSVRQEETVIHAWNDYSHLDAVETGPLKFDPIDTVENRK